MFSSKQSANQGERFRHSLHSRRNDVLTDGCKRRKGVAAMPPLPSSLFPYIDCTIPLPSTGSGISSILWMSFDYILP